MDKAKVKCRNEPLSYLKEIFENAAHNYLANAHTLLAPEVDFEASLKHRLAFSEGDCAAGEALEVGA